MTAKSPVGEMQTCSRRSDGALLARIDRLVVGAVLLVLRRAWRRYRAAAECGRQPGSPRRAPGRKGRSAGSPRRASPFSSTVASSEPIRQALPPWPNSMRSPGLMRLAGRAKAFQRSGRDAHVQGERHFGHDVLAALAQAFELRRDHLRIVENQRVAGAQEGRQVQNAVIRKRLFLLRIGRRADARCRAGLRASAQYFPRGDRNRTGRRASNSLL